MNDMTMIRTRHIASCLLVSCSVLAGCGGTGSPAPAQKPRTEALCPTILTLTREAIRESGLAFVVAERKPLTGTISIPAQLLPDQDLEAQVGSMVQGRVQKVGANVGDAVRPGMELMQIEGVEVGEIKARFITARAQLKFAESTLERQKTLNEQRVSSRKTLLEAQAEYDKARAAFDAEDKRIHSIGLRDADLLAFIDRGPGQGDEHIGGVLPIKSPIAGIIVERNVVIGQYVDAATTAFRIVNTERLMADGQIYEKDIPRVTGKPAVRMHVSAFPDRSFAGTLVYISPVVDERTRTITVRALIPNRNGLLKPHMFGELHVAVGAGTEGILVPGEAVQREGSALYVFVATSDTTFERRTVEAGETFDTFVEIRTGIGAGERIVTRGAFQLKAESMRSSLEGDE